MPRPERFRKLLEDHRARLLVEGDVAIEAPTDGKDEDEAPLAEMNQAIASSRNRERAAQLAKIDAALGRLDADPDAFGRCRECDEPIPPKRLELMPWVDLCVGCQQAIAEPRGPTGRRGLRDFK